MKHMNLLCLLLTSFVIGNCAIEQKKIVIITASYNNKQWYKRNLESLFSQEYDNWHLIYTDAASADGTADLVEQFVAQAGMQDKVTLVRNSTRKGPLENQFHAIHRCNPEDIIVILDGDDWLPHNQVLAYINHVYSRENVWLTYGQFIEYPSYTRGFCCQMPDYVIKNNLFREFAHIPSHMRTFYAGLFQRIKKEDLCDESGNFFMMTGDIAAMFPMIEMARDHFKFIDEIIYVYNGANALNEHKISKDMQRSIDLQIRSKPRYEKVESLFNS